MGGPKRLELVKQWRDILGTPESVCTSTQPRRPKSHLVRLQRDFNLPYSPLLLRSAQGGRYSPPKASCCGARSGRHEKPRRHRGGRCSSQHAARNDGSLSARGCGCASLDGSCSATADPAVSPIGLPGPRMTSRWMDGKRGRVSLLSFCAGQNLLDGSFWSTVQLLGGCDKCGR